VIFVDCAAFLGRYLVRDPYHVAALKQWDDLRNERFLTSNHVLAEALTLMARRAGYKFAAERAERIYFSEAFEIVSSTLQDEHEALRYFRKFADQQVSFVDCISFAIMKRERISTAFTFDRHFIDAGFKVIGLK
jgi:uncharacterized protein